MERLESLFGLYSEPVFAVDGGEIVYYNAAAQKLLPNIGKMKPDGIFPAAVLELDSDNFVGETDIAGSRATFSAARLEGCRIFSILSCDKSAEKTETPAFASMSLEMKNYLAVLRLAASVVLPHVENTGDEKLARYAAMINRSYYSILRLTTNMEVLGAGHGGDVGLKRSSFDLIETCRALIDSCAHLVDDREVKLSFSSALERLDITADGDRLEQMMLNMISNSLIYTEPGGRIELSVALAGDSAVIKVSDTGGGIPDAVKTSAWNRYEAPRQRTEPRSGAGFGMAAISQIARMHGGSVFYESRKGGGTMVAAAIPIKGDEPSSFHDTTAVYQRDSFSPILTGLSTVVSNEKFTQKYMD